MSVKVHIPSYLQQYTEDEEVVEVNGSTVDQCLEHLVKQLPGMTKMLFDKNGKLHDYVTIYVDGDFAYGDELDKAVKDGDEFHILYILGGG